MLQLEKISIKQFCKELEGKKVGMAGFRQKEFLEKDLDTLRKNQNWIFNDVSKVPVFRTTKIWHILHHCHRNKSYIL